jgi:hypothetical protein
MSECEAQARRFEIDHYEPRNAKPDLANEYANLMYSCDTCNLYKGDRCPPPEARAGGHRFFRPDQDVYSDHFVQEGITLKHRTNVGDYTITMLTLNRQPLRRLREIRERLTECHRFVAEGVLGLRHFQIDQLPRELRARALRSINQAASIAEGLEDQIDSLLRNYARSPLADPDPEADNKAMERRTSEKKLKALYPGTWRAPRRR